MEMMNDMATNARIKVFGVGGGGGNALNHMVEMGVQNVEFVSVNTDAQVLALTKATGTIQIGEKITRGLGAGANPDIGRKAAEESRDEIEKHLKDTDMVFVAAGMGGGSGTGAAPVIAEIAREKGILTVGVVTMPFGWEGKKRMKQAYKGRQELYEKVDTLITIPNNKLRDYLKAQNKPFVLKQAFQEVDNVLRFAVEGICDLILQPGLINLDFADIKTVMQMRGSSLMGIGESEGDGRAVKATEMAMQSPLLEHGIQGAKGIILNVTGGPDLTFDDLDEASEIISEAAHEDAEIIVGTVMKDESFEGKIQITIVATGFREDHVEKEEPAANTAPREVREPVASAPEKKNFGIVKEDTAPEESPEAWKEVKSIEEGLGIPDFLKGIRG